MIDFTQKQHLLIGKYQEKLLKFNNNYNLIGKSTINDFHNRHVVDSAQIVNFIDKKPQEITDFGSGAGLPAIILAILRPDCQFHLIEKSFRKCQFLQEMVEIIPNIKISQNKIEDLKNYKCDIIIARAFASLTKIIALAGNFLKSDGRLILHKGKKFQEEIIDAQKKFKFIVDVKDSISSKEGKILIIKNLCFNQSL